MKIRLLFIMFYVFAFISLVLCQNMDYYQPVGFSNPPLRSGNFLTTVYYYHQLATLTQNNLETDTPKREINVAGYFGLTDNLTVQTNLIFYPEQTIYELGEPQVGKDKLKFNIRPQVTHSYRPLSNFEIFTDLSIINQTIEYGEKEFLRDVPVAYDPLTGEPTIVEQRLVFQPALPAVKSESTVIRFGFTYLGTLW